MPRQAPRSARRAVLLRCWGMESSGALIHIRSYRPQDSAACGVLYREGLVGGQIAENDTGLDIDDIESAYLKAAGSHFWVGETEGNEPEVVGMIGVQHHDESVGEIRRLRVRQ